MEVFWELIYGFLERLGWSVGVAQSGKSLRPCCVAHSGAQCCSI